MSKNGQPKTKSNPKAAGRPRKPRTATEIEIAEIAEKNQSKLGRQFGATQLIPSEQAPDLRHAVLRSLDAVGGEAYLMWLAKAHPRLYTALLQQCFTKEVNTTSVQRIEQVTIKVDSGL